MSIVVNTNISSLMVQRSLQGATGGINKSLERLSTGYQINKAADDAAGLTISESLKAQARGSNVAWQNAQTGVNLLQTAEADLSIIQENLQRVRDLTVQAANGTYGSQERTAMSSEVEQRVSEISRIANSSAFNSVKLLNGDNTDLTLQIGANFVAGQASLNTLNIGSPLASATATALGLKSSSDSQYLANFFTSSSSAASFLTNLDSAITQVSSNRSTIGSYQNRLESTMKSLQIKRENMLASESRIRDVDVAQEAASLTRNQILQQASASLLAQANQAPSIALSLI